MKTLELDFSQLPLKINLHGRNKTKSYQLTSSSRKLAACLSRIEEPARQPLTNGK